MTTVEDRMLYTPPGFDQRHYFRLLNTATLEHSADYRRDITRHDPLMFALVYLRHNLKSPGTRDRYSLAQFHIDLATAARDWRRKDIGPGEIRRSWTAPREAAKSTWMFLINPLWALCHGWLKFIAAFTHNGDQSELHLGNLRREMRNNPLLQRDFPEICTPAKTGGRSDTDTKRIYVASSGAAIMASGLDSIKLGAKIGNTRPDLILIDDPEPDEGNYSARQRDSRLKTIVQAILPLNINAIVEWTGTTTMYGSLMHDLVRAAVEGETAKWIEETGFVPHYYAPIIQNPDGSERSMWPQRWPISYLQRIRHTDLYTINFLNRPMSISGGLWKPSDFKMVSSDYRIADRTLWIDPAVSKKNTSDQTGVAIVSQLVGRGDCLVEHADGVRLSGRETRTLVLALIEQSRGSITKVHIETNNGSEYVADAMKPLPPGVELIPFNSRGSKASRFGRAHTYYQAGWVRHRTNFPALVEQMLSFPSGLHDDIADAVVSGLIHYLGSRPL